MNQRLPGIFIIIEQTVILIVGSGITMIIFPLTIFHILLTGFDRVIFPNVLFNSLKIEKEGEKITILLPIITNINMYL